MQNNVENKKLFVISGSSGVGKGTIISAFLEKNSDFRLSISYTTREKREGEIEGVNYFYVSREEFNESIVNNEFLEWAQFSGNFYGTKKAYVDKCLLNNQDLILEIDTQGALQLKNKMPEAVLIFISPPSYQDLETRLRARNTEDEAAIQKRLDFVRLEMENSKYFDYVIVNDKIEVAVAEIERIIKGERANA